MVPTRESNALLGGLLTVDENRADVPSITDRTDFDENMLLNVEGIGNVCFMSILNTRWRFQSCVFTFLF